jgi:hypothetical protein
MKKVLFLCLLMFVACETQKSAKEFNSEPQKATPPHTLDMALSCDNQCCEWEVIELGDGYSAVCYETWCCQGTRCTWDVKDIECFY